LYQVGDLFELNIKLRCQKVNSNNTKVRVPHCHTALSGAQLTFSIPVFVSHKFCYKKKPKPNRKQSLKQHMN